MQLKHCHPPQPEIPPPWSLQSSTAVVPDTPSALPKHQRPIQRLNWSPSSIPKAAAWSFQDPNCLDTRRAIPSLATGPLTQHLPWGDIMTKSVGFPTVNVTPHTEACWPRRFTQRWEAQLCNLWSQRILC